MRGVTQQVSGVWLANVLERQRPITSAVIYEERSNLVFDHREMRGCFVAALLAMTMLQSIPSKLIAGRYTRSHCLGPPPLFEGEGAMVERGRKLT